MIPGKLHPMVPHQWYFGAIGLYFTSLHILFRGRGMVSAMRLSISIVALSQFALYCWRAVLAGVAAQPVSHRVLVAARVENGRLAPQHFQTLAGLHDLTPDLQPNRNRMGFVRVYFRLIEGLDAIFGKKVPAFASWSERERAICARYAAVLVDRRLQANLDLAASLRAC